VPAPAPPIGLAPPTRVLSACLRCVHSGHGKQIDIMVVHDAATFPGIILICCVIGVLQIEQKSKGKTERNDRLFAVPRDSHSEQALKDVRDLSKPIQ
jgi:inorganic pyrophosphatase